VATDETDYNDGRILPDRAGIMRGGNASVASGRENPKQDGPSADQGNTRLTFAGSAIIAKNQLARVTTAEPSSGSVFGKPVWRD
jgi:hypothetical protein